MVAKLQQAVLPFRIEGTDEPLIARAGLVLPYEMAKALRLPQVVDQQLPPPGSGHAYKPSQFVMPLVLMLHGGGKKLEDLRACHEISILSSAGRYPRAKPVALRQAGSSFDALRANTHSPTGRARGTRPFGFIGEMV